MNERIKWSDPVTGLDGVIAAAQALKDGRPVQVDLADDWVNIEEDDGLYAGLDYRIGEEVKPRDLWLNVYDGGSYIYESKESADREAQEDRLECIHVREVVE